MTAFILLLIGLLLIFLEFFVPGAVLGAVGAILMVGAWIVYIQSGAPVLQVLAFVTGSILGLVAVIKLALWSVRKTAKHNTIFLNTDQEGYRAPSYEKELKGKKGTCHTPLRPGGFVLIEGNKYDAVSLVGFLEKGEAVEVVEVEGETLQVKRG